MPGPITLPARQAFVLQFGVETDPGTGRFVGRIEHVLSGRSDRFRSPDDFLAFVKRVLNELDSEEER